MKKPILRHMPLNKETFNENTFENLESLIGHLLAKDFNKKSIFLVSLYGNNFVSDNIQAIAIFIQSFGNNFIKNIPEITPQIELYEMKNFETAYNLSLYTQIQFIKHFQLLANQAKNEIK